MTLSTVSCPYYCTEVCFKWSWLLLCKGMKWILNLLTYKCVHVFKYDCSRFACSEMFFFVHFSHQVAKSKITTAGTYVPPKSHPTGSTQSTGSLSSPAPSVSSHKQAATPSQPHQQQVSTTGIFMPPNGSDDGTSLVHVCSIVNRAYLLKKEWSPTVYRCAYNTIAKMCE